MMALDSEAENKRLEEEEWETMRKLLLKDKDGRRDNDGGK